MRGLLTVTNIVVGAIALLAILFVVGWFTREDPQTKPYLAIQGGGFIFNYRISDVYYGFTAIVQRPLPTGSVVEVEFENPGGGAPHIVRQRMGGPEMSRFSLRSPSVRGVEAGKPYSVAIRIFDREETELIWSLVIHFTSQISDDVVPDKPLTIGPGYTPNPGASE